MEFSVEVSVTPILSREPSRSLCLGLVLWVRNLHRTTLFSYTTLFRSQEQRNAAQNVYRSVEHDQKTDQTSLGQFSGRVQQTYKHSVPRFFVPEHGTMFTLALVRFPPTATKEIQYLNAKGALTYTEIGRASYRE